MKRLVMLLIIATTIVAFTGCGQLNVTGVIKSALNAKLIEEPVVLYVDGEAITVTGGMFTLEEVKKGPHTLRVEHPGFAKYEKTVELDAGSRLVIALLSKSEPFMHISWANEANQYAIGIKVFNGQIYVSSSTNILRYSIDGTFIDNFVTGLTSQCYFITFDDAGNLWGVDEAGKIHRFNSSGAIARTYEGLLSATNNWGLALDQTYIYVSDITTNKIKKYKQADGVFVADIGTAEGIAFNTVTQLVFGPDGNLYAADTMNGRMVVLSASLSVLRTFSVKDDGEANPWPIALAFGPDDCLYVHDRMNDCIKKICPDDDIIQKIPTSSMFVNGLAFDDFGNLYVTDNSMNPLIHAYYWDRGIDR